MEALLRSLLPKLIGPVHCNFQLFPGKPALLRRLPPRLRALRRMWQPGWLVLIIIDCDRDDCRTLKRRLEADAHTAGLMTRSSNPSGPIQVINRIAIEELEAWYFGDWQAVMAAYPRMASSVPARAAYRVPDAIAGGTSEALERLFATAGYFSNGLPKIEIARRIGPHMEPARNTSRSFQVLRDALLSATQ